MYMYVYIYVYIYISIYIYIYIYMPLLILNVCKLIKTSSSLFHNYSICAGYADNIECIID